ncbi:kelch repeat and BTB domain-containing protein 8-like [Branchiostoma floridae]|uniref:Kelch repeat and BTB domain-containing protein 8-like n=1 Tax=Branchiostoma floridae TaxID=7739 RepID=A0A9J7LFL6_BRAFL|nr:kelch repeat and BTB domain-containing protein 8-like [Branchiostoma floridae]
MFGEILTYIYSGTLQLSMDKVQPLYQAADLLQLDYVRDTCSNYMSMNVEHSTCVDLYKFADIFSMDIVRKRCLQLIHSHFAKVASIEDFCSLNVNQLTEIISHDGLDVKEETTVWEAVVRWVQHSREDRLHHLPSILPHIRFNLLASNDTAAIFDHPLVREDSGSSEVIRNIVQQGNPILKPRLGMETMGMVLMSTQELDELFFMNPRKGKYIICNYDPGDIPYARAMTVTSDNNIYMLTVEHEGLDQLCLFRYNHAENVWQRAGISSVPVLHKSEDDCLCYEERLFEIGGILYFISIAEKRKRVFVAMRKYDGHTDWWLECWGLQLKEISQHTLQSCGSHLYFLTSDEMYCYDPSQDCWDKRTPPKLIPNVATAIAMGTEIFCTDLHFTNTMVYDTQSDRWQKLQGWPKPENLDIDFEFPPGLFVLENRLHIWVEAVDSDIDDPNYSTVYRVYVYDRSADAWRDLQVTLPDDKRFSTVDCLGPLCPVAHIYIPHLKEAHKHSTRYHYHEM